MQGDLMSTILMIALMFGLMWFMLIRPAQKRQKQMKTLQDSLQVGDEVMTSAGVHGTVEALEDNIVHLQVAKGVTMRYERQAIIQVVKKRNA